MREVKIPIPYLTRELHIVTERPNTEPKLTPSVLKNWETEVQFSSGVGFGGTVLSLSYERRERERRSEEQRDGGVERDTKTERGGTAEGDCFFFFRLARERGWWKGGLEGERERDEEGTGGERDIVGGRGEETNTQREGGRGRERGRGREKKIIFSSSPPREREGGEREGGRGRERGTKKGLGAEREPGR